jgi:hypothetical protein
VFTGVERAFTLNSLFTVYEICNTDIYGTYVKDRSLMGKPGGKRPLEIPGRLQNQNPSDRNRKGKRGLD